MSRGLFWLDRIERLANLRGLSLEELIESLDMHRGDFEEQCISRQGPGIQLLRKVTDSFEITLDDFLLDRVDEEWVKSPHLAAHFLAQNGSKFRTSLTVIRWLEKEYGPALSRNLLRSLKVPQRLIQQPDQIVKLKLLRSLLRMAVARGVPESDLFEMGVTAVDIPENAPIRRELASAKNTRQLFEIFFDDTLKHFEANYNYRILRADTNSMTFEVRPKEECIFENGNSVVSDRLLSIYRWGVTAGLLKCLKLPAATALPLKFASQDTMIEAVRLSWDGNQAAFFKSNKSSVPSLRLL